MSEDFETRPWDRSGGNPSKVPDPKALSIRQTVKAVLRKRQVVKTSLLIAWRPNAG